MAEQLSYCARQVRSADHDRFLSALFAPAAAREHVFALYAFNIEIARIRDMVSEPLLGEIRLQWWRESLAAIYARQPLRAHPVLHAVQHAIDACAIPQSLFDAMLDARARDFENAPPESLAALEGYADATSAGLMRMALLALGETLPAEGVRHAGIAWALTGLLRSIGLQSARGQILLPADMMQTAGLDCDALLRLKMTPELQKLMQELMTQAEAHLAAARRALPKPAQAAMPALLPVTLADTYIKQMRRRDYDPFQISQPVPAFRRQLRMLWAMLRRQL